jgi:hypothetical protein
LRLRNAAIAIQLACLVAACVPDTMTQLEAIEVAKSHMQPGAVIESAVFGALHELAPDGLEITDPDRRVWLVTMRGVPQIDCKRNDAGGFNCPLAPKQVLLVLDGVDGSPIGIQTITITR